MNFTLLIRARLMPRPEMLRRIQRDEAIKIHECEHGEVYQGTDDETGATNVYVKTRERR